MARKLLQERKNKLLHKELPCVPKYTGQFFNFYQSINGKFLLITIILNIT